MSLEDIVDRLIELNDDNLVEEVKNSNDVQWCLSELQDLLEVIGDMNDARLRELAEADKEGRVVVLPCKVGDTVYEVTSRGTISEYDVMAARIEMFNTIIEWRLRKGFVDRFCDGIPVEEIGETVFLTREEAEKALEAKQNG